MGREKKMTALYGETIRTIVEKVNNRNIKKEDIVSLVNNNGQYILVYYE